jgi:hypothetical protein
MDLSIMWHSSEVKPFFATAKVAAERIKDTPIVRPFPILAIVCLLIEIAYHLGAAGSQPCHSSGMLLWREIFCLLIVAGFWNVIHLMINNGTSSSHLRLVPPDKPYESETPC